VIRWVAELPPTLYSYCIPIDDGAAPNPYWNVCTLAICKPVIRRTARVGDWIAGTGAKSSPIGDIAGTLVYAMKVTGVMSMPEYDAWTLEHLPEKVPAWGSRDNRRRLGDSIYDFSSEPPRQRPSVHGPGNIQTDLSGENVLLSDHFYYFGNKPVPLPDQLLSIVRQGQGHRSWSNQPHAGDFLSWLEALPLHLGLHGSPQLDLFGSDGLIDSCAETRAKCAEEDEVVGEEAEPDSEPNTTHMGQ